MHTVLALVWSASSPESRRISSAKSDDDSEAHFLPNRFRRAEGRSESHLACGVQSLARHPLHFFEDMT